MNSKEREVMELALEGGGLYEITGRIEDIDKCIVHRSVIKEALAQPDYEKAYIAWQEKTEWVQETVKPHELGMHRADVLKQRIEALAQQSNEQGCEHCNHSLYCGTKCKNCGKQSNEQVEPAFWYSAQEDEFMTHKIRKEHERLNSYTHKVGKFDLPLYTHPPVPYVVEPRTAQPDRK